MEPAHAKFIPMKLKIKKKEMKSLNSTYKRLAVALAAAGDIEIEPDESSP
jgi:hypothetical protein